MPKTSPHKGSASVYQVAIPAGIAALVVFQGGYYAGASCAIALGFILLHLVLLLAGKLPPGVPVATALLAGVGVCNLIGAGTNETSLSMLLGCAFWFAVAGMSLWLNALGEHEGDRALAALCWVGIACACVGVLVACGALPLPGAWSDGRLHFLFQYANTAGIWLSVTGLLAAASPSTRIRSLAFLPFLAALLTQSVGSIGLCFVGLVASSAFLVKTGRTESALMQAVSFACAIVLFGVHVLLGGIALAVATAALAAFALFGKRRLPASEPPAAAPFIVLAALALAAVAFALIALPDRVAQASQTFIERFIQIADGLAALSASPLFGIGPDMWGQTFPLYQTAQYHATSIHCGYLQIALDSGLAGLLLFAAFVVWGMVGLAKRRDGVRLVAVSIMLLHFLIDFDLQFSSVVLTLALLLYPAGTPRFPLQKAATAGVAALLAALCLGGVVCDLEIKRASADPSAAKQHVIETDGASARNLYSNDTAIVTAWYTSLYRQGDFENAALLYERLGVSNGEQAFAAAAAYSALGDSATASSILVAELERQPYNTELFEAAAELFAQYGVHPSCEERYRSAIARANDLAETGHAALLNNQKQLEEPL